MSNESSMSIDWQNHINDPNERLVFEALADPNWDFRSTEGIAKSSNLPLDYVDKILKKYQGNLIRKSDLPDKKGRELYTLMNQSNRSNELLDLARVFISKTI